MASITSLPPEILCRIFLYSIRDLRDKSRREPRELTCADPPFAQVSRSWRNISLNEPTLWNHIDFSSQRRTEELLRRCRDTHLVVIIPRFVPQDQLAIVLGDYLSRIEELQINGTLNKIVGPVLNRAILGLGNRELPLRSLIVSGVASWDPESPLDTTDRGDFATIMQRSPKLQNLALCETVNFPWGTSLSSSLTTLRLQNLKIPTLQSFLDSLRCMPQLQELHLLFCFPKDPTYRPSISTHAINLPCLVDLTLDCVDLAEETFFHYLNIPHTTRIEFQCQNRPSQPSAQSILGYLSDRLIHSDLRFKWPPIRRLIVTFFGSNVSLHLSPGFEPMTHATFDEWKEASDIDYSPLSFGIKWGNHPPSQTYTPSVSWPQEVITRFFTDLFLHLPLRHLQVLSLFAYSYDVAPDGGFTQLFDNLPEVVLLKANSWNTSLWDGLLQAQQRLQGQSVEGSASRPILLPNLRYVQVTTTITLLRRARAGERAGLQSLRGWLTERLSSSALRLRQLDFIIWESEPAREDLSGFEGLAEVVTYTVDEGN